jgi:cytochrome c-type biogenesis protein CcmE
MKPKHQRFLLISGAMLGLGLATLFIFTSLRDNLIFFYTPSELQDTYVHREKRIRVGGLVKPQSVARNGDIARFVLTDQKNTLKVVYEGVLPDLFREGQGIVAEGYLQDPTLFRAEIVLAKHDETYMPKEVADRLKRE